MRTNVYVDGFNLYYRAVRGTAYKWLDLSRLCQRLVPTHQINRIRYFTARVQQRPHDVHAPLRQQTFIRALETIPNVTIHWGQFRTHSRRWPLVTPKQGVGSIVSVWVTEEKGSDVNLAAYLLMDGFENDYEQAVVISNDSDLVEPIKMVRDILRHPVGIVNPNLDPKDLVPKELRDAATFTRRLHEKALRDSQFPLTLTDANGTFTKPISW